MSKLKLPLMLGAAMALGVAGCNKKEEDAGHAAAAARDGKNASPAPIQAARLVDVPGAAAAAPGRQAASLPAGHPPVDGMAGAEAAGAAPAGGGSVAGTLSLDEKVKAAVRPGGVLYIIVRPQGGGTALAVKRVAVSGPDIFPLAYQIGPAEMMVKGGALVGPLAVEARIDQDGDAISKGPGDVEGKLGEAKSTGATDADFTLDVVL